MIGKVLRKKENEERLTTNKLKSLDEKLNRKRKENPGKIKCADTEFQHLHISSEGINPTNADIMDIKGYPKNWYVDSLSKLLEAG